MFFFFTFSLDVHYKKERMRDRFMDRLKAKHEPVTEEEAPVRKMSFARHFVNAMLSIDEDEQDKSYREVPFDDNQKTLKCPDVTPPSEIKAQDDVEMLKDLRQLPPERKISLFMSILNGIMGSEAATGEKLPDETCAELLYDLNELNTNEQKSCTGTNSNTFSSAFTESLGVDNKGLDCNETELRQRCPDQITVNNVGNVLSSNDKSDSLEENSGVSNDPESALQVSPAPKTVRAWLKDPKLYKVIIFPCCIYGLLDAVGQNYIFAFVVSLCRWPSSSRAQMF